jgi:uncharacterized protein YndB with AHSA1/START domain
MSRRRGKTTGGRDDIGAVVDSKTYRLERILPGPIERVWSYLIDPAKRRLWFADGPVELRVGGQQILHFRFRDLTAEPLPRGSEAECTVPAKITRYEPPTLLSYTWGSGAGASQVTFELTSIGNDVRLVLTHTDLCDPESMIRVASGWYAHLGILAHALGGPKPAPFWQAKHMAEDACRLLLDNKGQLR